jgi:hypothetical protein
MLPDELKQDRTFQKVVNLKSETAKSIKPFWIWESDPYEAEQIHLKTKLPVLCIRNMVLLI